MYILCKPNRDNAYCHNKKLFKTKFWQQRTCSYYKKRRNKVKAKRHCFFYNYVRVYKVAYRNKMLIVADYLKPISTNQFDDKANNKHYPT